MSSCQDSSAFPRNNNFITVTLDVPKMFINTITFCLSRFYKQKRIKFIFLVSEQLYFILMKAASSPLPCHVGGALSARQAAAMPEKKTAASFALGLESLRTDS